MTYLDLSVVNYAHGGGHCDADQACGHWDFLGLRRMMRGERWPDVLVICEAERWALTGGKGAWGACIALREEQRDLGLRERPYIPLPGTLTQNRGPIAPCILVDPSTVSVSEWFDGDDADAYERTRNLLQFTPAGQEHKHLTRLIPQHWPWNKPLGRVMDAEELTRYAKVNAPGAIICGDFNEWPDGDDVTGWDQYSYWHTVRHSMAWAGLPGRYSSSALDMLLGYWDEVQQRRIFPAGNAEGYVEPGFFDAGELAKDDSPTEAPKPPRVAGRNMRFLLNAALKDRLINYQVHEFLDDTDWDSDHKRVSITLDLS